MAKFINSEKARSIAYSWHGGQFTPLYAFASSGIIENLSALIREINSCATLAGTTRDCKDINALLRYIKSGIIAACPDGNYRAPWGFKS
jgi:hypothetical protein